MELLFRKHVFEKYRDELSPLDGSVMVDNLVVPSKLENKIREKGEWFHNNGYNKCENPVLCFIGHKEVYAGRISKDVIILRTCYRYKRKKHDALKDSLESYKPNFN